MYERSCLKMSEQLMPHWARFHSIFAGLLQGEICSNLLKWKKAVVSQVKIFEILMWQKTLKCSCPTLPWFSCHRNISICLFEFHGWNRCWNENLKCFLLSAQATFIINLNRVSLKNSGMHLVTLSARKEPIELLLFDLFDLILRQCEQWEGQ